MTRTIPSLLAGLCLFLLGCDAHSRRPNVVLITVDTLRTDRLGAYGHDRATSPVIDELARVGLRFEHAFVQAPWTLPSMASLHTSLYASQHGADRRERGIAPGVTTLAEELQGAGYHTMGVVSHVFVSSKHGFHQGFDRWDQSQVGGHDGVTSPALTAKAKELLSTLPAEPFFLWVHYFDPHSAYVRHDGYDFTTGGFPELGDPVVLGKIRKSGRRLNGEELDHVRAVYDGEIAFTDRWIGELIAAVSELGLADDTLFALTSDHGEAFLDHGELGHGKYCYDELVRAPLLLSGDLPTSLRGRVHEGNVEVRSLARTIAEVCGVQDHAFSGDNLLGLVAGDDEPFCLIEGSYAWGQDERRRAVVFGDWKLISRLDKDENELYDLAADPLEQTNLWDRDTPEVAAAKALLLPGLEHVQAPVRDASQTVEHTAEELELLRKLGYGR